MIAPVVLSLVLAQEPQPQIRLICSLQPVGTFGDFEIRIENTSPSALDARLTAELVLEPVTRPRPRDPLLPSLSYRAGLDLSGPTVVTGSVPTRLEILAHGSKTWRMRPKDLLWHKKVSATRAGDGGFRSVVPPGKHELDLLLQRTGSGWWASRTSIVTVGPDGTLAVHVDEEK
jgi:hypothetical protein